MWLVLMTMVFMNDTGSLEFRNISPPYTGQDFYLDKLGGFTEDAEGLQYFLDRGDKQIKVLNKKGSIVRVIGGPGQGPGEFIDPVSMHLYERELWVYDSKQGAVTKFDLTGDYLGRLPLRRAYAATFLDNSIVLQVALDKHLFHHFDLKGNLIRGFGAGIENSGNLTAVLEQLSRIVVDQNRERLYAFYLTGQHLEIYDLATGNLLLAKDAGLAGFGSMRGGRGVTEANSGRGIRMKHSQPVKGVLTMDDHIMVLLVDENQEDRSLLAVYDHQGELMDLAPTPHYYKQAFSAKDSYLFYHGDSDRLDRFRISWD
jgi:hypothetical protein